MATAIPSNEAAFALDDLVRVVAGELLVAGGTPIVGVSTDSRTVKPGNVFVALSGERFDGHEHVRAAVEAGATALIVSRDVAVGGDVAVVRVRDTLEALGSLGRVHRRAWTSEARAQGLLGKVVAVTGSAGKTTTCRATTAVLEAVCGSAVHAPVGNLNNAIGIPMVLLGLGSRHGQAVIEVGTNSPGEIAYGASLVEPDVAIMTLVACAHTLGLGSIEAVAEEKGALFASILPGGVCVANADDPHVMSQVARSSGERVLTFGKAEGASVRVVEATSRGWEGQDVIVAVRDGKRERVLRASVPLLGAAGVYATTAALATAWAVCGQDVDWDRAIQGLRELCAESGRLRPRTLRRGAVVIDDAYNANPASMRDSIDVAAKLASEHGCRLTLVLGEMRELGEHSEREHRRVGDQVGRIRPSAFVAVGGDARFMAEAARKSGVDAVHVADAASAVGPVLEAAGDKDVILVKGSRGVALERVVRALEAWGEGQDR